MKENMEKSNFNEEESKWARLFYYFFNVVEFNQLKFKSTYTAGKHMLLVYLTKGHWHFLLEKNFSLFINFGLAKFHLNCLTTFVSETSQVLL